MKILITGAGGKIGRILASKLSAIGELVLIDHQQANNELAKFGKQVKLDLLDQAAVINLLVAEKPEVIIHLAAIIGKAATDDQLAYQVNVEATLKLAQAAANSGVKKFIFASSAAVYPTTNSKNLSEDTENPQPASEYGQQKYQAEQGLAKIASDSALQIVCLRIFNVYGPGFDDSLVNKLMAAAKADGSEAKIIDPDHFTRDYIHVDDVAAAFAAAITQLNSSKKFSIINIASGVARSTTDLIAELTKLGFTPNTNLENGTLNTFVVADVQKAKSLIGFTANQSLVLNQL